MSWFFKRKISKNKKVKEKVQCFLRKNNWNNVRWESLFLYNTATRKVITAFVNTFFQSSTKKMN